MSVKIYIATRNSHKVGELRALLAQHLPHLDLEKVCGISELGIPEPVEDGVTFKENALIKARQIVKATGVLSLADDSGLCVDVLGGSPGVFSARWAGVHGDDVANIQLLQKQLADVPAHHRQARFKAAVAVVSPDGNEWVFEGEVEGKIAYEPCGTRGFGYDPLFIPNGFDVSMAELSPEEKNAISHRGRAIEAALGTLVNYLK